MSLNNTKKSLLIVGCGKMGLSHLVLFTPYIGKKNLIVVEKKMLMRCILFFLGYKTLASLPATLEKMPGLRAVLVATPTRYHYEIAKWAIEKKLNIFVEKPLTLNPELSRDLVFKANKAELISQVGFVMRFMPSFVDLRALILSGELGEVKNYTASMRGYVMTPRIAPGSWQGNYQLGGGCLNEFGPHLLDLCRFLFGNIDSVMGAKMGKIYSADADDWVTCRLQHHTNLEGNIELNWSDKTLRKSVVQITVEFERASVYADSSGIALVDSPLSIDLKKIQESISRRKYDVDFYLRGEEFSLQAEAFLHNSGYTISAKTNHTKDLGGDLSDGLIVDELINQIASDLGY